MSKFTVGQRVFATEYNLHGTVVGYTATNRGLVFLKLDGLTSEVACSIGIPCEAGTDAGYAAFAHQVEAA